jgi:hypothetical protein
MGLFGDLVEGFVTGLFDGGTDEAEEPERNGRQGVNRIEACCAHLGWSIDGRVGERGVVLNFNDPLVRTRPVLITVGSSGHLAMFSVFSAAEIPPRNLSTEMMGHLLLRNKQATFPAWQIDQNDNGNATFAVTYCALVEGLEAGTLKLICEAMCKEVHEFDAKLRQAGLM